MIFFQKTEFHQDLLEIFHGHPKTPNFFPGVADMHIIFKKVTSYNVWSIKVFVSPLASENGYFLQNVYIKTKILL